MIDEFHRGDIVAHFFESVGGHPAKFVVTAFDGHGGCVIDKISSRGEILEWGRMMYPNDHSYVKVGTWDFENNKEVDEDVAV